MVTYLVPKIQKFLELAKISRDYGVFRWLFRVFGSSCGGHQRSEAWAKYRALARYGRRGCVHALLDNL